MYSLSILKIRTLNQTYKYYTEISDLFGNTITLEVGLHTGIHANDSAINVLCTIDNQSITVVIS